MILSCFYFGRSCTTYEGYLDLDMRRHRNRILLRGYRQGARRMLPPDLHRIESASGRLEIMRVHVHNKRLTLIVENCEIVYHQ